MIAQEIYGQITCGAVMTQRQSAIAPDATVAGSISTQRTQLFPFPRSVKMTERGV